MHGLLKKLCLSLIALVAIFFASACQAQELLRFDCEACRDITEHPEDARNFALNLIYGRNSSLGFDDTRFTLSDVYGNTINVDINAQFILDPFDYRLFDQLFIEDILIQIVLFYPNGDLFNYKYSGSLLDPLGVLPVPANSAAQSEPTPEDPPSGSDWEDNWTDQDDFFADWEEAWGGWTCRPDFSHPNITGVICRQG